MRSLSKLALYCVAFGLIVSQVHLRASDDSAASATQPAIVHGAPTTAPAGHPYARIPASPAKILTMAPNDAYTELMVALACGDQSHVEQLLTKLVAKYPTDQPLRFFQAVCTRSRFEVRDAARMFYAAALLDPATPEGKCAILILKIDLRKDVKNSFTALIDLVNANPDKLLIQWAAAIACRTLNYNTLGVQIYRHILCVFDPGVGPSLMHQTFANLLDNTQNYKEALIHRQLAVRLEPSGWSYQGLANTLDSLHEYDKADQAYAEAVVLDPNESLFWETWGNSLRHAGRNADANLKFEHAVTLNPACQVAWSEWGASLEFQGQLQDALEKYQKALDINPNDTWTCNRAAHVLTALGHSDDASKMLDRAKVATAPPPQ